MILEFGEGRGPSVARHHGKLAIVHQEEGESHGFLLPGAEAVALALRILAGAGDLARAIDEAEPEFEITGLGLQLAHAGAGALARLTFVCEGATLAGTLSDHDLALLAAATAQASRFIDRLGAGPGPDR
jgi:hypothetical protein